MTARLYTKPSCQPCKATKREFDKLGLVYEQFDITKDPSAADAVRSLGYSSVPVVVINDDWHWTGFRPTEIAKLSD